MRSFFLSILIILLSLSSSSAQSIYKLFSPQAVKVTIPGSSLKNIYRIDDGVYRSEQPGRRDFRALESYGIREVLTLRYYNNDFSEVRGTSITALSIRTRATKIDTNDIINSLQIIRHRQGPILIHCWHGSDRTGAVTAMYRIVFQGWSKEAAIDEMVNGGFGFHSQFEEIIDMINSSDISYIKRMVFTED